MHRMRVRVLCGARVLLRRRVATAAPTEDASAVAAAAAAAADASVAAPFTAAALRNVRGTHDLVPGAAYAALDSVVRSCMRAAAPFGYTRVETPVLEERSVFVRSLGAGSDVVRKEMFAVRSESEDIVLRPEGTAAIVRAAIMSGAIRQAPLRWLYACPMFRYERPQRGRLRQVGLECIGGAGVAADFEALLVADRFLTALLADCGVPSELLELHINTLGDTESRVAYGRVLAEYLRRHESALSEASRERVAAGHVLRVLDSKNEQDRAVVEGAPRMRDVLTAGDRARFDELCAMLRDSAVAHVVDETLVRGLDYYTGMVFEYVDGASGAAQSTVLAGGRYDGLVSTFGAPSTPAVGWAAGVERLMLMLERERVSRNEPAEQCDTVIVTIGGATGADDAARVRAHAARVLARLSARGRSCVWAPTDWSVKRQMRFAVDRGAAHAVIVGADEAARGTVSVKCLRTQQQRDGVHIDGV